MAEPDPAAARFWTIQLLRLSGVVLVVLGVMIVGGVIALPAPVGVALLLVGLVDFLVVPLILARRWRTPK